MYYYLATWKKWFKGLKIEGPALVYQASADRKESGHNVKISQNEIHYYCQNI